MLNGYDERLKEGWDMLGDDEVVEESDFDKLGVEVVVISRVGVGEVLWLGGDVEN
jgi:hypothetical protein